MFPMRGGPNRRADAALVWSNYHAAQYRRLLDQTVCGGDFTQRHRRSDFRAQLSFGGQSYCILELSPAHAAYSEELRALEEYAGEIDRDLIREEFT